MDEILVIPKEFKPSNFIVHKITLSKVIKNLHNVYYLWPCKSLSQPFQCKNYSLHWTICVCVFEINNCIKSYSISQIWIWLVNVFRIPIMIKYKPIQLFILIWRFIKTIWEKIWIEYFPFHLLWPLTFKYLKLVVERHLRSRENYFKLHQNT